MYKRNIVIAIAIVILLSLNFLVKPYLRRQEAIKAIKMVLTHWKNGDFALAAFYWEKEESSPPVYDLIAYKIGKKKFEKKDGLDHAWVSAVLDFSPSNPFPSGQEWIFKLSRTRYGWKITNFRLSESNALR